MTELLLVRHGQPQSGVFDPNLSEEGFEQARRLAAWLSKEEIDGIVTSSSTRARETASVLEDALGPVAKVLDDLREWDHDVPAAAYTPVELMDPSDPRARAVAEGWFEEFVPELDTAAFGRRVVQAFNTVFDMYRSGRVIVSTHGGVINIYLAYLVESPRVFWFNPQYTSVSRVEKLGSGLVVVRSVNETAHLRG